MNCLIDPRKLLRYDFGPLHPFKIYRLGLTYNLMESYGLTKAPSIHTLEPREADEEEALSFHTEGYLEILRLSDTGMWVPNLFAHGLGTGDNPVFPPGNLGPSPRYSLAEPSAGTVGPTLSDGRRPPGRIRRRWSPW